MVARARMWPRTNSCHAQAPERIAMSCWWPVSAFAPYQNLTVRIAAQGQPVLNVMRQDVRIARDCHQEVQVVILSQNERFRHLKTTMQVVHSGFAGVGVYVGSASGLGS